MRTGIFGGSFNPIHKGHVALAENILKQGLVEELWLMVSPQNPLKRDECLLPDDLRLELAQIATLNHPNLKVSDFEYSLPKPSYMYLTLKRLGETFPDRQFSLIIGADNWLHFHQWVEAEYIQAHYPIIVYPRRGYGIDRKALPKNATYLSLPYYDISSTTLRQRLREGMECKKWLEAEVEARLKPIFQENHV